MIIINILLTCRSCVIEKFLYSDQHTVQHVKLMAGQMKHLHDKKLTSCESVLSVPMMLLYFL